MSLRDRISALSPTIEALRKISGSPGLSLGVIHRGQILHTQHFGYRDVSSHTCPDNDTIYHIASLTKLMTAAATAILVNDGYLDWDVPIRNYLPAFQHRKDEVGLQTTLRDLLSNRTGLTGTDTLYAQMRGEFLIPRHENIRTAISVPAIKPFRENFVYSNWNYSLAQEVIETVTGKTLDAIVQERIAGPLGMSRTTLRRSQSGQGFNAALPYNVKTDGTPVIIDTLDLSDDTGHAAAGGGKSTIHDLLLLYQCLMTSLASERSGEQSPGSQTPFAQLQTVFTPHVRLSRHIPVEELAYCLGLYRTRTPGSLSNASINAALLSKKHKVPRIGLGKPGVDIFYHTGNLPGYLSSHFLIPSSQSAVVVLTNAFPLMDPTDYVAQSIIALLLDEKPSSDYIELAKSSALSFAKAHVLLQQALDKRKTDIPPSLPIPSYTGEFFNELGNYVLTVVQAGSCLRMISQRNPKVFFDLEPYDGDRFYWPANRDEEISMGMVPRMHPGWHVISFGLSDDGTRVTALTWEHDRSCPAEVFRRRSTSSNL